VILHLIETGGPGGAEQMLLRLADEYGRRGILQLVCLRKEGWLADEVRRRCLPLEIIPLGRLPDLAWLNKLGILARTYGVTAIHTHEFAMNVRGAMLAKWLGLPAVATVHGKGYYGDKFARRLAYRLISRLTNIVAVSEDIRTLLINMVGINSHLVSVIPNGVDIDRFSFNAEKRRIMRDQLGVLDNQLLLGTVGSYYPVKGHGFLIEAMQQLLGIHHNIKLVMAGQGPLVEELQKKIILNGLESDAQLIGYIEDTTGLLSALDIFVMPSLSEGQPLALLEAAANGRCIVSTNVGGIPEIVQNGENAILVPAGDTNALVAALSKLIDEPETRSVIANNAESTIKSRWSIQGTAERYLKLLYPN